MASSDTASWSARFHELAYGPGDAADVVAVGALPFDHTRPACLWAPVDAAWVDESAVWAEAGGWASGDDVREPSWAVVARPSREEYERLVARVLERLEQPGAVPIQKVVLARTLQVTAPHDIDVHAVLRLLAVDDAVTTFAVPLPSRADGRPRTMVGATPELLVEKTGSIVVSEPLAGSAPRSTGQEDADAAAALLASEKDRREHATVVEWIADRLTPFCRTLHVPSQPGLTATRTLWHLRTPIDGILRDDTMSSVELAELLHPTPAVCGVPVAEARALLTALEPFERDYFAGAVGWSDRRGNGRWMMTLRCADVSGREATLYAGAGIVAGSQPVKEAVETSVKFRALLDALGVTEAGAIRP